MKKLVACLALLMAVGCSTATKAPEPPKKTLSVETLRSESVAFVQEPRLGFLARLFGGSSEPRAFCSGVWVSQNSVLTANHCVDQEDEESEEVIKDYLVTTGGEVQDPNTGKQYKNITTYAARVYARDPAHDLALVRVTAPPSHATAEPARGTVAAGDKVANMGQPLGLWFSFATGVVASVRESELASDYPKPCFQIQTTTPTSPGNSGGGLFNEQGELVGIAHAAAVARGRAQNLSFYIDTRYIRAFLDAQGDRL